jgi:hypothetical protein
MRQAPFAQMDLLTWKPPEAVARFDQGRVRAASIGATVKRAIAEALRHAAEAGFDRDAIALGMSDWLGEKITKSMLDAYASQAREGHQVNLARFVALLVVTKDARLLQVLAEPAGLAVIDGKYAPLIELASLREHEDAVRRRTRSLRSVARATGALR